VYYEWDEVAIVHEENVLSNDLLILCEQFGSQNCLSKVDSFVEIRQLLLHTGRQQDVVEYKQKQHFDGRYNQIDFGVVFAQLVDLLLHVQGELVGAVNHFESLGKVLV
jgi:hypothetical protein